jgi:hypothetical protein
MDIVKFAESELRLSLSYFQKDLLLTLQHNPEPLTHYLKPMTNDIKLALSVYEKWKEHNTVAC